MTTIKITNGQEIRRITLVGEEARGMASFSAFATKVQQLFPALVGQVFSLVWYDDDGDKITVSSDIEFQEAIRSMRDHSADGKGILRFEVLTKTEPEAVPSTPRAPSDAVHNGITCDECGMSPIQGLRFKCTVRNDYDLCAGCEAKRVQPYPMVKISTPDHAPSALFYAFRDDRHGGRGHFGGGRGGCHGGRGGGCRRGGYHRRSFGQQVADTLGVPVTKEHEERAARCREHWQRRAEEFATKAEEAARPFVEAVDKMFAPPSSTSTSRGGAADSTSVEQQLEEQMMQDAIQESLLLDEVARAFSESATTSTTTSQGTASAAATASGTTSAVAAPAPPPPLLVSGLTKPALRFVKDVSYPDGTAVHPGSAFRKVWKVRNDGAFAWPAGAVLIPAGGDLMCAETVRVALPCLEPTAEVEVAVELTAPQLCGMYTAYFRAQTKEGQAFGHRVWCTVQVQPGDVVVEDVDEEVAASWTTVSAPRTPDVAVAVVPPATASAPPAPPVEVVVPIASAVSSTASASSTPAVPSPAVQPLHLLWRKELQVLADMGFGDADLCVPLLQQHLTTPVALSGDRSAVPDVQGMQRVVATLLGM